MSWLLQTVRTVPKRLNLSYAFIPHTTDECGNGGSIGIRWLSGGAYGMGPWDTRPTGTCPDATTTELLGTSA